MRLSVREMILVVAIAAFAIALAIALSPDAYWVGGASIPIDFLVLDASTGQPIGGASVRLAEGNPEYQATTDPTGKARIVIQATTAGRSSLRRRTRSVNYGRWWLVVSAIGYMPLEDDLGRYTRDRRYHYDASPPPIVIRIASDPAGP